MSAIERAKQELEQGDFAAARVRLASYLRSKGYDVAVLDELGRISLAMHDPYQAGRYWFASGAAGEEAERAIARFQGRFAREPRSLLSALPAAVRLTAFENLPADAQRRLRERGLEAAFSERQRTKSAYPTTRNSKTIIPGFVLVTILLLVLFVLIVGLITIVRWLRG